jgi:hypothetical protein
MNATLPIKNNILVYKGEVHKGNGSIVQTSRIGIYSGLNSEQDETKEQGNAC